MHDSQAVSHLEHLHQLLILFARPANGPELEAPRLHLTKELLRIVTEHVLGSIPSICLPWVISQVSPMYPMVFDALVFAFSCTSEIRSVLHTGPQGQDELNRFWIHGPQWDPVADEHAAAILVHANIAVRERLEQCQHRGHVRELPEALAFK